MSDEDEACINPNTILPRQFHSKNLKKEFKNEAFSSTHDSAVNEVGDHSNEVIEYSPHTPNSLNSHSVIDTFHEPDSLHSNSTTNNTSTNIHSTPAERRQLEKESIRVAHDISKSLNVLSSEIHDSSTPINSLHIKIESKITDTDKLFKESNQKNVYRRRVTELDFKNVTDLTSLTNKLFLKSESGIMNNRFKFDWKEVGEKLAGKEGENKKSDWMKSVARFCMHPNIGPSCVGFSEALRLAPDLRAFKHLDSTESEPSVKRKKVLKPNSELESATKNTQYEFGENDQISNKIIEEIKSVILSEMDEKKSTQIEYLKLVVDGNSFPHTIENIFHCSFLISKEDFGMSMDDRGVPWLFIPDRNQEPCKSIQSMENQMNTPLDFDDDTVGFESPVEKRAKHSNSRQYVPAQGIFSLNPQEWQDLVRVLKLESVKNLLP